MATVLDHCEGAPRRQYGAGDALITAGEATDRLCVLATGEVEVLRGETRVAVVSEPGAMFGEMSVLLARPHTATVRALSPASVYVIDDAGGYLKSNPEIALAIGRMLAAAARQQSPLRRFPRMVFGSPWQRGIVNTGAAGDNDVGLPARFPAKRDRIDPSANHDSSRRPGQQPVLSPAPGRRRKSLDPSQGQVAGRPPTSGWLRRCSLIAGSGNASDAAADCREAWYPRASAH
jgi:hypothetical protein